MSEQIIKSCVPGVRDLIVAYNQHVVIAKSVDGHPEQPIIAIPIEDFPAVFAALKQINNEILERFTI
ncbi:hypothetical protein G9X67_34770 [Rhizobium sp. WYCCWR 11152]|uniref:hypothetical protein n=1 Tax=Rhizobium sp. WYCCWR 11152 TaxID=2692316 RepID=UPI001492B290|nr:hypothetical protein [Rhizobium sp. WYCCWR 11152]NNU70417.1 hypothetical protein [Rhizobium sp. WYCCWR 11152]